MEMFNIHSNGESVVRSSKLLRSKLGIELHSNSGIVINARTLMNLKLKALRRGLWYKAINRLDRMLVDLTIKAGVSVHSSILAKELLEVIQKLCDAVESKLNYATRTVGFSLAEKLSILAQKWNYKAAMSWATDRSFARFLAILNLYGVASP